MSCGKGEAAEEWPTISASLGLRPSILLIELIVDDLEVRL
jgi:hypothetical protein